MMTMRTLACFVLAFPALPAAAAVDTTVLRGTYRFVHLTWSDGAQLAASSRGGTITFDGMGGVTAGDASGAYTIPEPHLAQLSLGGNLLAVRFNPDTGILAGSAAEAGPKHHLFAAVRAAEGLSTQTLQGTYGLAALTIRDAAVTGLATAYGQFAADGAGQFTRALLTGHAALIDDVNRKEERAGLSYELASDGTGVLHLGAGSDVLNGDRSLAISADGGIVLGWSADPAQPGLILGVRKSADVAAFSFRGRYWLTELFAENSFAFQKFTRIASAWGSLASNMTGAAYVSQHLLRGGETTYLSTSNAYKVNTGDATNSFGPKAESGVDNFAFNDQAFVGARIGAAGKLTLDHGLIFGLAAPINLPTLSNAAAPAVPDAPMAPGAIMTLSTGAGVPAPDSAVRINGAVVPHVLAAGNRLEFRAPASLEAGPATIEILVNGKVTQAVRAARAASAPMMFTADGTGLGPPSALHADSTPITTAKPATPGETIFFQATGLGAAPTLRVLFDGQPGIVTSADAVDGQPGRYRIKVEVPGDLAVAAGAPREIPVALATPESFSDLGDLPVMRSQAAQP